MKLGKRFLWIVLGVAGAISVTTLARKYFVYEPIRGNVKAVSTPISAYVRALRPNYPYSVIAGGAYSPAELRYADRRDPVVQAHYADFSVKDARAVELTADRMQYVSYRKGQEIFWTKKKLRIPKGEVLLTDGSSFARTRCGNRLSDTPRQPVAAIDPPLKQLALPEARPGAPMELAVAPPVGELAQNFPALNLPPVVVPPPSSIVTAPTPELPFPPAIPIIPIIVPPGIPPTGPPPSGPPITPPPPIIPPNNPPPPVAEVPEPKAIYLFVVTFILSLYWLTRMLASNREGGNEDEISKP